MRYNKLKIFYNTGKFVCIFFVSWCIIVEYLGEIVPLKGEKLFNEKVCLSI